MSKKPEPERGGGVKIAKQFTVIREQLDRNGNVVTRRVEEPKKK